VSQAIRQHYDMFRTMSRYANTLCENGELGKMTELSLEQVRAELRQTVKAADEDEPGDDEVDAKLVDSLSNFCMYLLENWNGISVSETQLSVVAGHSEDGTKTSITDELYTANGDFDGPHCKIKSGMSIILKPLLEKVDKNNSIRKNEQVLSIIKLENGSIEVKTSSGTVVEAKACVSTIPLGCLQATADKLFDPKLSDAKMEAIGSMWSGSYKKVFLTFDRIFWPKDVPFIGLILNSTTNHVEKQNNTVLPGKSLLVTNLYAIRGIPSMEVVLCGDLGKWAYQKSDETCHITRWEEDPFTRGSYSTFRLGTKDCHVDDLRAAEWYGRLFFAGESTEEEHMGSVHAALMSGNRAAREVLDYLSKKTLPELTDPVESDSDEAAGHSKRKGEYATDGSKEGTSPSLSKRRKTSSGAGLDTQYVECLCTTSATVRKKPAWAILEQGDDAVITDMMDQFQKCATPETKLCLESSSLASICSTVQHIQQRDQWSCGFRNLQMMLSAIIPHVPSNHAMFQQIPRLYFNFNVTWKTPGKKALTQKELVIMGIEWLVVKAILQRLVLLRWRISRGIWGLTLQ
ncbi:MAG: hypothetical protein SGILL_007448, partial [Bacillariaceae sp.]